jgi:hypothetical protein
MADGTDLLLREFLDWVAWRRRTYAEAMEAWRSSCPRHTVWEDALLGGLIRVEGGGAVGEQEVILTPRGRALLDQRPGQPPRRTDSPPGVESPVG